jgi:hypothetical protein
MFCFYRFCYNGLLLDFLFAGSFLMLNTRPFAYYQTEIARQLAQARISEPGSQTRRLPASPDERLAQCIWFDSLFLHGNLKTDSGKSLEILQPGVWNECEGPDFNNARLRISGKEISGDIEIHLDAAGWRQHRHHLNPTYNKVILHAYLWPEQVPRDTRNSDGLHIEGFAMGKYLFPDLDSIRQTIHAEDYPYHTPSAIGRCQPLMTTLDEDFVGGMLNAAGHERLEEKTRRFLSQQSGESLLQVFYQSLMTAMGHGACKSLFFLLSKRTPFLEMLDYLIDAGSGTRPAEFFQSILLHVAQLAPTENAESGDAESAAYLERLRILWHPVAPLFADRIIPPTRQWFTHVRPVNFAQRRLAGIAYLLERFFLNEAPTVHFQQVLETFPTTATDKEAKRWIQRNLIQPFVVEELDDFWTWRYTFASRRAARGMKLVGDSRAASIALNALLPLLLLHARSERNTALEKQVHHIFQIFPALDSNVITRQMQTRLFGEDMRGKTLLSTEARQQGLFHIFRSCCALNERDCTDCAYRSLTA